MGVTGLESDAVACCPDSTTYHVTSGQLLVFYPCHTSVSHLRKRQSSDLLYWAAVKSMLIKTVPGMKQVWNKYYQPLPTILLIYSLVSAAFVSAEIFEVRACLWLSVKFQGWERPGAYNYA